MCMDVLVYSCGGQRLSLGVTLCHPTLYIVEKIPLPEPEVHKLDWLARNPLKSSCLPCLLVLMLQVHVTYLVLT